MGVRIEHPQSLVDSIQYHGEERGEVLPPASYRLVCQANGRGFIRFACVPAVSSRVRYGTRTGVTNGWSLGRNNPFANSGMVVQLTADDWEGLGFRETRRVGLSAHVERCWEAAGQSQRAPAQRLMDFLAGKNGRLEDMPDCSCPVWFQQPPRVLAERGFTLAAGLRTFGKRMPRYLDADAILIAPESRIEPSRSTGPREFDAPMLPASSVRRGRWICRGILSGTGRDARGGRAIITTEKSRADPSGLPLSNNSVVIPLRQCLRSAAGPMRQPPQRRPICR